MDAEHSEDKLERAMSRLDKIREPDNLPTWSVLIGCFLAVVFILGSAYSRQGWAGLLVFIIVVVYLIVIQLVAHVNVFRILWGATIHDETGTINRRLVVQSTVVMAFAALGWLIWDVFSDDTWGLFSWIGAAVALIYLAFVWRDRASPERN